MIKVGDVVRHPCRGRGKVLEIHHERFAYCWWSNPLKGAPIRSVVNLHVLEPSE